MRTYFRTFRFVISFFLAFSLFCARPCFGAVGSSVALGGGAAFVGLAAVAALVLGAAASDDDDSQAPVGGNPVVLSQSDYNLLSVYQGVGSTVEEVAATTAMGKIYVQNKSEKTVSFDIHEAPEDVVVDPNSSCMQSVSSDGICTFDISYTSPGSVSGFDSNYATLEIKGKTSDYITVNKIGMAANSLYDPTVYDTKAHGIDVKAQARSFAKITKDGVEFVYVGTSNGVYKSSDNGATWLAVNNGLIGKDVSTLHAVGAYLYAGVISSTNEVQNGGSNVFKSTNGGATWVELDGAGLDNTNINTLVSYDTKLCAGTNDKVYCRLIDGIGSWELLGTNMPTSAAVYALHYVDDGDYAGLYAGFYMGTYGFVGRYNSDTNEWDPIGQSPEQLSKASSNNTNNDDEASPRLGVEVTFARSLLLEGNFLYAGVDSGALGGVYRIDLSNSDPGNDWVDFATGLPANAQVNALHYIDGYLYAGTNAGNGIYKVDLNDEIPQWRSDNTGMAKTLVDTRTKVSSIYSTSSKIFVGFGFEVSASGEGGLPQIPSGGIYSRGFSDADWDLLNNTLLNKDVRALYAFGGDLYAGTYGLGVFKSADGGANWSSVEYSSIGLDVKVQAIGSWSGAVYIGTDGDGVYELTSEGWVAKNGGLTNKIIHSLGSWEKATVSKLYAATSDDAPASWGGLGIYDGNIWSTKRAETFYYDMHDLSSKSGSDYLYIGGQKGITSNVRVYRYDGGTGDLIPMENTGLPAYEVYALHSIENTLYAGTNGDGVYTVLNPKSDVNPWVKVGGIELDGKPIEDLWPVDSIMFVAANDFLVEGGVGYSGGSVYGYYGGPTWTALSGVNLPQTTGGIYALYAVDTDLFAGTSNLGVLKAAVVPVSSPDAAPVTE